MLQARDRLSPELLAELRALLPGASSVLCSEEDLLAYGYDGTWFESRPLVVVMPQSAEEVAAVHRLAAREGIPITPRGMGSGLSGGAIPSPGAISLNLMRMNRILKIDPVNRVAIVEPGVITADLQKAVEREGMFYPPDPSSLKQSAIGGNVAENAGGARCLKYGVTANYVAALQIVLPAGEIIRVGGMTVKNVTGYDLRSLFVGAEGTLGTITEITLWLLPKPRFAMTALAIFDDVGAAARTVTAIMAAGFLPTSIELLDRLTIACVSANVAGVFPGDCDAVLIFAVDGNYQAIVESELEECARIAREHGATRVDVAHSAQDSERIWNARRAIAPALARRRPNRLGEDICVPRSAIAQMLARVHEIAARHQLEIAVFGHAGDGNLHPNILCDRRNREEIARVTLAAREIFEAALELGGTLSGEHGIGILKKQFMELDLGSDVIALMRRIKDAIDPQGIMNPGKVFPDPGGMDAFKLQP